MMYVAANNRAVAEAYARSQGINKDSIVRVSSVNTLKNTSGLTISVLVDHIDEELETMLYIISVRRLANITYCKLN